MQCFGNVMYYSAALDAFTEVVKVTNHTRLWDAELAWYSPIATRLICLCGWSNLAWSSRFLESERNFFKHLLTLLLSTAPLLLAQQMYLIVSTALWSSSNSSSTSSRIKQSYNFICTAFKSHIEWSNSQRVCALTTTTAVPFTMAWTVSVTWYTHCKLTLTKILKNFWFTLVFVILPGHWPNE